MADLIRIKAGNTLKRAEDKPTPELAENEVAYSKDEKALFIGTADGNVKLCKAEDVDTIAEHTERITAIEAMLEEINARFDATESV